MNEDYHSGEGQTSTTVAAAAKNDDEIEQKVLRREQLLAEANWFQMVKANSAFEQLRAMLLDCCRRLNATHKISADLPELASSSTEPRPRPALEKFSLQPRSGQEGLTAVVALCGERVVQAEVSLKYAKSASGFYRATAMPEVHWKMQQLLDAANLVVRAMHSLCQGHKKYTDCLQKGNVSEADLRNFLLSVFAAVKADVKMARSALTMPKKKSLVELCNFHPVKSFVPPLPHDILLSFYISSAKLICAAYQVAVVVPTTAIKRAGAQQQQTVTIFQAECQVPRLIDIVQLLNTTFAIAHDFASNFALPIAHSELMGRSTF